MNALSRDVRIEWYTVHKYTSVVCWCLTGEVGCQLEQHVNVGEGLINTLAFKLLMTDERFNDMPVILDTPGSDLIKQIKHLYKFCD